MMELLLVGIVAGVLAILALDVLSLLLRRAGLVELVSHRFIGRLARRWVHERFYEGRPSHMVGTSDELLYGRVAHGVVGAAFALLYLIARHALT